LSRIARIISSASRGRPPAKVSPTTIRRSSSSEGAFAHTCIYICIHDRGRSNWKIYDNKQDGKTAGWILIASLRILVTLYKGAVQHTLKKPEEGDKVGLG